MNDPVRLQLVPLGASFQVERGTPLQDALFAYGVEFPCGGRGRCKGCRVKLLAGGMDPSPEEEKLLGAAELAQGWRLACRARAESDLTLEIAQWEATILADETVFEFQPGEGLGLAVDLGTTTLVAQLLDLKTGCVLGMRTALNPQARHGADVMSRVQFAALENRQPILEELIRKEIGGLAMKILEAAKVEGAELRQVVIVGNTVMHHLFSGVDIEPLSRYPFEPERDGAMDFPASRLGWKLPGDPRVSFLPCLGGFVGSDILGGILATRLDKCGSLSMLIDLGTNGEIVLGDRDGLLCASTAAGPAFEGARISYGMRAATGAIASVSSAGCGLETHVLGNTAPRGICGSGLVDAAAVGLDLGIILPSGRLAKGAREWMLRPPVSLTQTDIRELQLAKGAIAAGIKLLLKERGASADEVERIYLAGAFGNYINRTSARRIGLLDFPEEKIRPAGNTALLGAKMALFQLNRGPGDYRGILEMTRHVPLASSEEFQETFIESMGF